MSYLYYGATQEAVANKYSNLGYTEEEAIELALLEIDEDAANEDESEED
jgi:hypothetical protein